MGDESGEHVDKKIKVEDKEKEEKKDKYNRTISYPTEIPEEVKSFFVVFLHSHGCFDPSGLWDHHVYCSVR